MRKQNLLWAGFLLSSTLLGWAQSGPDKVCEINVSKPKAGAAKQFEEARKQHNNFHKTEKDKNAILVWSVMSGPATGDYLTAVCGMTWKSMDGNDAMDQRDDADRQRTMAPTLASNQQSYYILRSDLSKDMGENPPTRLMTATHYFVKPSGIVQFTEAIKKINAAMDKTKYPMLPWRWYQLVNGGEGPHYVLVMDRKSWGEMQGPEQSMADMMKQAYGEDNKTLQSLREAVDHTMSELMNYRADLSYLPAK